MYILHFLQVQCPNISTDITEWKKTLVEILNRFSSQTNAFQCWEHNEIWHDMIWNSQFMNQLSWWHRFPSDEYTKPPRKPFHTVDHSWPVINKKHTIIDKHIKAMFGPKYQTSIKCKGSIMAMFLTFVDWKLRPAYIILVAVVISAKSNQLLDVL